MFSDWRPAGGYGGPDVVDDGFAIRLGDYTLDGLCKITSAPITYRMDWKDAKGKWTAFPTCQGLDTQSDRLEIDVFVWTLSQKEAHGKVALDLAPRRGSAPQPVPIVADQIADLDITHVQILKFTEWQWTGTGWRRKIVCGKWYAEEKAASPDAEKRRPRTATKPIHNKQKEDAERRRNPPPAAQKGAAGPTAYKAPS